MNMELDFNRFTERARRTFAKAAELASDCRYPSLVPQVLMVSIIQEAKEMVFFLLQRMDVDRVAFCQTISDSLSRVEHTGDGGIELSENVVEVLVKAQELGRNCSAVALEHVFWAFCIVPGPVREITYGFGVDERKVSEAVSAFRNGNISREPSQPSARQQESDEREPKVKHLKRYARNLTLLAEEGRIEPVIGRDSEIRRILQILSRKTKNNPVLVGPPGTGKTAIVEGLAHRIIRGDVPQELSGLRIWSLDMTALMAGTSQHGEFEERLKSVVEDAKSDPNIVLFIDEMHLLMGAGGSMDAANILKPSLARGKMQCIGATTLDEYRKSIEKDGALERRFQKVIVEPTTREQTLEILGNIRDRYEDHHSVSYTDEAIKACVELTERYVTDRHFPDKAIDALDETGAHIHVSRIAMSPEVIETQKNIDILIKKKQDAVNSQDYELAASYRDRQVAEEQKLEELKANANDTGNSSRVIVNEDDVADVVSRITGIPVQRMCESENQRLRNMPSFLKQQVVAQDAAIDKMVKAIQRNRIGLRDPNRPIGVFMFLGPTGVGKTYLAKQLAEYMFGSKDSLIRIDMSEFGESFNVSRLVGAPPGYVGFDEGGQLTEKVRRRPYSIVLLDEIEKAHANVFNMLLQVLDEGRLTDGTGRLVDFRNTVIIMTSNAGTRQLKEFQHGVGFNAAGMIGGTAVDDKGKEYARGIIQKALSKQFAPEFLNRLDEIVTFDQLDQNAIRQIVEIEIKPLVKRVEEMGYLIEITGKAKDLLAKKGYDIQFGARPLKRALQNYVEDCLCEMIISDKLKKGDSITIDKADNEDKLTFNVNH